MPPKIFFSDLLAVSSMINQSIGANKNSSPRGIRMDTPIGGVAVNLNLYDNLPNVTNESIKSGITTTALCHVEELKSNTLQHSAKQDTQDISINQLTEKTEGNNLMKVEFLWPVSTSVKPIKKKTVRLKPPRPTVLLPFASLINTEDAVTFLRKLQFY